MDVFSLPGHAYCPATTSERFPPAAVGPVKFALILQRGPLGH